MTTTPATNPAPTCPAGKRSKSEAARRYISGQRVGLWTVVAYASAGRWLMRCECGQQRIRRPSTSKRGESCGCRRAERVRVAKTRHGHAGSRDGSPCSPEYYVWASMIQRCINPKRKKYECYGGRGIRVCDRWLHSFDNFLADMGDRPKGMTLDRYPNQNGNYEPGNCRWATRHEQHRNARHNRFFTVGNETLCLVDWARRIGIGAPAVLGRLSRGWPLEKALTIPKGVRP